MLLMLAGFFFSFVFLPAGRKEKKNSDPDDTQHDGGDAVCIRSERLIKPCAALK